MYKYFIPAELDLKRCKLTKKHHQIKEGCNQYSDQTIFDLSNRATISNVVDLAVSGDHANDGTGGEVIQIYNFTDKIISIIDASNRIRIIEPIPKPYGGEDLPARNYVVIDIGSYNNNRQISDATRKALHHRMRAFSNQPIADELHHELLDYDNRRLFNYRHQYCIENFDDLLDDYAGAFFFKPANVIIASIEDPFNIALHPASDIDFKDRIGVPTAEEVESYKMTIGLNDANHNWDRAFVNMSGQVIELNISRNPSLEDGLRLYQQGDIGQPPIVEFYPFGDEKCPHRIYRSRQDALECGDMAKATERAILSSKVDLAKQKLESDEQEFMRRKLQNEEAIKAQQAKLDQERKDFEYRRQEEERIRMQKIQDEEENRRRREKEHSRQEKTEKVSFWRRFLLESAKAVAAAATAATIIIGVYLKSKTA